MLSFRCDSQPAVTCFHTSGCAASLQHRHPPPNPHPPPAHPSGETTGHRAGASLHASERDTQPDQYLCISCPFAQVSSLIITARWSFNELAGRWGGGGAASPFPTPGLRWMTYSSAGTQPGSRGDS